MKAKIHKRVIMVGGQEQMRTIVAICDAELLGRTFVQGDAIIDLEKYRSFYEGNDVNEDEAIELIRNAKNINLVGEKSVGAAKKALNIEHDNIKRIAGIPHLQIYYV